MCGCCVVLWLYVACFFSFASFFSFCLLEPRFPFWAQSQFLLFLKGKITDFTCAITQQKQEEGKKKKTDPLRTIHQHTENQPKSSVLRPLSFAAQDLIMDSAAWKALQEHYDTVGKDINMRDLFAADADRFKSFRCGVFIILLISSSFFLPSYMHA